MSLKLACNRVPMLYPRSCIFPHEIAFADAFELAGAKVLLYYRETRLQISTNSVQINFLQNQLKMLNRHAV